MHAPADIGSVPHRLAGEQRGFKLGGALLAQASGAKVVPIAHNSGFFWPGGRLLVARPGVVQLVIGQAFDPSGLQPEQINQRAKQWIDQRVSELEPRS